MFLYYRFYKVIHLSHYRLTNNMILTLGGPQNYRMDKFHFEQGASGIKLPAL